MRSAEVSPQTGPQCQTEDWPTHKTECRRQNYILKVDLLPRFITNPRISRTLSCPATATFATFHQALLVTFGWVDTHLYDFDIFDYNRAMGRENRLSGPEPIFKITDLNTVDEIVGFPDHRIKIAQRSHSSEFWTIRKQRVIPFIIITILATVGSML